MWYDLCGCPCSSGLYFLKISLQEYVPVLGIFTQKYFSLVVHDVIIIKNCSQVCKQVPKPEVLEHTHPFPWPTQVVPVFPKQPPPQLAALTIITVLSSEGTK